MPTYHTLIVAHTMQPSESPRNTERASKTLSCSHPFEEGVLQIQIALSKAGGWWEGGNTSSVDLHHTMESHSITQIKPEYKQAHSSHKETQTATCPSHFLWIFHFFSLLFILSFAHRLSHRHIAIGTLGRCHTSYYLFSLNIIIIGNFLCQLV